MTARAPILLASAGSLVSSAAAFWAMSTAGAAPAPLTCHDGVLYIRGTELVRLDDATDRYVPVAELPMPVNALAYVPAQNLVYGIAGSTVVTINPEGHAVVRGPAPHGTSGAYAGAVSGMAWYVRSGGAISVISVDPAEDYLRVVRRVPVDLPGELGDMDVDPADGRLYGVTTGGSGPARVVRIDPRSGRVTVLARPAGLPNRGSYGSVVIRSGVLTATLNATGTLYRIPLANPARFSTVRPTGTAPTTAHADAAGCPNAPPSPFPSPSPSLSPKPSRTPSPSPSRTPPRVPPAPAAHHPPPPPTPPTPPTPTPPRPAPLIPPAPRPSSRLAPWHPTGRLPLAWSIAVLMIIPTAAGATRVAGKALRRRT